MTGELNSHPVTVKQPSLPWWSDKEEQLENLKEKHKSTNIYSKNAFSNIYKHQKITLALKTNIKGFFKGKFRVFYGKNKGYIGLTQNYRLGTGFIGFARRPETIILIWPSRRI